MFKSLCLVTLLLTSPLALAWDETGQGYTNKQRSESADKYADDYRYSTPSDNRSDHNQPSESNSYTNPSVYDNVPSDSFYGVPEGHKK